MNMEETQKRVTKAARHWLKSNKKAMKTTICDLDTFPPDSNPVTVFMAGSPGAGKTEFSVSLTDLFKTKIVRIDADEIREMMREIGYNGKNAHLYQEAVSGAVSNLYKSVVKNRQSVLVDGTFAYPNRRQKIDLSLEEGRLVEIYYLYQDPALAWKFVKAREARHGRAVPPEVFVNDYLTSINNVEQAKKIYGERINLYFVERNYEKEREYVIVYVNSIVDRLPRVYNEEELKSLVETDD